ncbi:low molecular weight protein-tyrosine-phosphatase [Oceanobacillus saliphilus]|uniref:low molecular weight protein-tyrosine-phosphatase n=1 Tax=Oceanobacillus saliphilus TaxID=2925834 RepID=UPI00201E350D|nr:low molecular weight protein-tyrosine-phosphatase [Oceanobacillus saliphilus]
MIRVLFVCLGNICRSPMAEAIFRELVKKENLSDRIEVDSGGTGNWHVGKPPHEGTMSLLERERISSEGLLARQVKENDWDDFDYIIAMDEQNIEDLGNIRKGDDSIVIAKLMDFVENPQETNIPDPYFTGDFDYTYQLVSAGCRNLLNHLKVKHDFN